MEGSQDDSPGHRQAEARPRVSAPWAWASLAPGRRNQWEEGLGLFRYH
jgi:hypothetical protein